MLKKSYALLLLCLGCVLSLTACFGQETTNETNDLKVYWQVMGGTCSIAEIPNVQVDLLDADGILYDTTLTLCSNGESLFRSVPVGVYKVRVIGLDLESKPTYESATQEVTVDAGDDVVELLPPLELSIRRASLEVSWGFSTGKLCQFEGVDQVEISVWDQLELQVLETQTVDCNFDPSEQETLPDGSTPSGLLFSELVPRSVRIEAFGLDDKGLRVFSAAEGPMDLEPGDSHEVELTLYPCEGEDAIACQ